MPTDFPTPTQISQLDSAVFAVTRARRMRPEDIDDFRQEVHTRMAERGYDVFRRFSGRSSLRTYLLVVVHRLLLDWQNHAMGKWRPSVAAVRLGPLAVSLDRLIDRDGLSIDEAVAQLTVARVSTDPARLYELASQLPIRRRRHVVATELAEETHTAAFVDLVELRERTQHERRLGLALARAMAVLTDDDRRLVELRYRRRLTVRQVAARLRCEPKPLYRRFERILLALRERLAEEGITGAAFEAK